MHPSLRPLSAAFFLAVSLAKADGSEPARIEEDFSKGRPDPHWWSVDTRNPPGVKVDTKGEALRFVIPPGPSGRPPAVMKGRFRLEGDFDIRAKYRINAMPDPKAGWINAQIFIEGGGGPAAVIRTNHSVERSGYSLWWEPAKSGTPGAWSHAPTDSKSGVLGMRREGKTLRFYFANVENGEEGPVDEIGTVPYGDSPITKVEIWVTVPQTESPVDVAFDDISIEAERIADQSVVAESPLGPRAWYAVVFVAIGLLLATFWWSRGRNRPQRLRR